MMKSEPTFLQNFPKQLNCFDELFTAFKLTDPSRKENLFSKLTFKLYYPFPVNNKNGMHSPPTKQQNQASSPSPIKDGCARWQLKIDLATTTAACSDRFMAFSNVHSFHRTRSVFAPWHRVQHFPSLTNNHYRTREKNPIQCHNPGRLHLLDFSAKNSRRR